MLEITSLTTQDLEERPNLRENLVNFSEGIGSAASQLCEILKRKLKSLNSSCDAASIINELLFAAHEVSIFSVQLATDATNLEDFQDKVAVLLEVVLKLVVLWDRELINHFQQSIINLRKPLIGIRKTQFLHEIVSFYKVFVNYYKFELFKSFILFKITFIEQCRCS